MPEIESFQWYRLRLLYCDWCEKSIHTPEQARFMYLPSGTRIVVHFEHITNGDVADHINSYPGGWGTCINNSTMHYCRVKIVREA